MLGNLTVTLAAVETAKLDADSQLFGDIQMVTAVGIVTTLARYDCCITDDVTRAMS